MAPIEVPPDGWEVSITADQDGDLARGQLGIVSSLSMPAPCRVRRHPDDAHRPQRRSGGRRTSTTTDVPQVTAERTAAGVTPGEPGARARLTYEDDQGPHVFTDAQGLGRRSAAAAAPPGWTCRSSTTREGVARARAASARDADGRFFIQDVSLWGTSVDGEPIATGGQERRRRGAARPRAATCPPRARIGLADAVVDRVRGGAIAMTGSTGSMGCSWPRSSRRGVARLPRVGVRP